MGWFYGNGAHMTGWGWAAMTISSVLLLALLGTILLLLVRLGSRPVDRPAERRAPEQLLGERFARGEIDEDEYRRRLDVLAERRTPAP
ncbi:SHOCT domain-containing protein [Petropleomorpha daqingensis]|nr:SHOCT domain-containing protein [Petropleomorpha daqingensis]